MGKYKITLNGKEYEMEVELNNEGSATKAAPAAVKEAPKAGSPAAEAASAAPASGGAGSVNSPMPGTILKVNVSEGDEVKAGQAVVVLEAMKMENDITSPKDGKVVKIAVSQGQTVAAGQFLFEVE
ncbi:MAG: biotin/lipoyl-binding protein [Clostridiales bacterium]|nr:biotin/lipoyl-binding protein [Clostridiales bacterium]